MLLTHSAGAEDCFWLKSTLIYSAQHPIKTAAYVIPIILHSFFPLSCAVLSSALYSLVLGKMVITKNCNYNNWTVQSQNEQKFKGSLLQTQFPDQNQRFEFYPNKAQLFELLSNCQASSCMKTTLHIHKAFLTTKLTKFLTSHQSHFSYETGKLNCFHHCYSNNKLGDFALTWKKEIKRQGFPFLISPFDSITLWRSSQTSDGVEWESKWLYKIAD